MEVGVQDLTEVRRVREESGAGAPKKRPARPHGRKKNGGPGMRWGRERVREEGSAPGTPAPDAGGEEEVVGLAGARVGGHVVELAWREEGRRME